MKKIKISVVSYLNSVPFIYGLENSTELINSVILEKDIPSISAQKTINGAVDIGLVPVAIIPELKYSNIVSDYCIGANGNVKSVLLVSEVPLNEITEIYLDYQSRTSIKLVQVLAKKFWEINPVMIPSEEGYIENIKNTCAGVIIGDRTFNLPSRFRYIYDLAGEWKSYTGLPFVFAAWVANKPLSETFIKAFNKAITYGIQNIDNVIAELSDYNINISQYLNQNISYNLDEIKKQGMNLFLSYL